MLDPTRTKLEKHDEAIVYLQIEQARIGAYIQSMDARIDRNQVALIESLSRIETKVNSATESMNKSKGGHSLGHWLAGIALTIIGITVAFMKFFKS